MIRYVQGDIFLAEVEAIVNPVNVVGVMGKGLALAFKEAFPANFAAYAAACQKQEIRTGKVFVTKAQKNGQDLWIINFPTKRHWRDGSQLGWIVEGLADLQKVLLDKKIRSIAIPPLGCGLGGLDWAVVRPEIERAFSNLPDVDVLVFSPKQAFSRSFRTKSPETP